MTTLLIASITPVVIFLYFIYQSDLNKEPWKLLVRCFVGGMLSIVLTLMIVSPIRSLQTGWPVADAAFQAFALAAIPEELSKWLVLWWFIWRSAEFDEYFDGIKYAVFVSMGFALVENILYVVQGGLTVAFFRAVLAVPGHGFFAVIMGYYFSMARFGMTSVRGGYLLMSLLLPMVAHGMYNFFLFYMSSLGQHSPLWVVPIMVLFSVFVVLLWRIGLGKVRKHMRRDRSAALPVL